MKKKYKVIIIGGGVAGIVAAIAAESDDILIIEASPRVGKKLISTGNGKCNLLNKNLDCAYYNEPYFVTPIFNKYNEKKLENFYINLGLRLRFDETGRGYPFSENSATVLEVLRRELVKRERDILTDAVVNAINKCDKGFLVNTSQDEYIAEKILFATGSDASFGMDSLPLLNGLCDYNVFKPSLTPLCTDTNFIKGLNGVRIKCLANLIENGKIIASERGEVLFKSFGLSGIAIFNLSAYYARSDYRKNCFISLNLLDESLDEVRKYFLNRFKNNESAESFLTGIFHKMLIGAILNYAKIPPDTKLLQSHLERLAEVVTDFRIPIIKAADKSLAQVMSGGVSLNEIDKNTLESKKIKGLYFAGEIINVDGLSGGYNLMWATASALVVAEKLN